MSSASDQSGPSDPETGRRAATGVGGIAGAGAGRAELAGFVRHWMKAANGTGHVAMTRAEKTELLTGLAGRMAMVMCAPCFDPAEGHWIGAEFARAGFDSPEALGHSTAALSTALLPALRLSGVQAENRLAQLLQSFSTGFARTLRDRTLDAQEQIRLAAISARDQSEQELRESERRFRHAASHDALTGIPNRTWFTERLERIFACPAAPRLAVCFVYIDGFGVANKSLGPQAGDELLVRVAERLRALAEETGCPAARLGDKEFVVLVEETTCPDDAVKVADRILALFGDPFRINGLALSISAKIGIVERRVEETDPTDLMRAADMTLHWAKEESKARWVLFDSDRNARDVDRYRLSAVMPEALARREFTLEYQPLVELTTGTLVGLEALARWRHPEHGLLGPGRFISLAEGTGLIVPLGLHLLDQACTEAARWQKLTDHPPYVSVNLAVRQLRYPGLVGEVAAILDRTGLPPHQLQLEITESAVIDPDNEADTATIDCLHALDELGVRIAIDDFGTGYSNLIYLSALPIRGIKLDRTFLVGPRGGRVTDLGKARAVLNAAICLGHQLGLVVTAEGVETEAQMARLRQLGCDTGQGWYFSRPVPASAVMELVAGERLSLPG